MPIDYSKWDAIDVSDVEESSDGDEELLIPSHPGEEYDDCACPAERDLMLLGIPFAKDSSDDGWLIVGPGKLKIHPHDKSVQKYSRVIFEEDPRTYVPDRTRYTDGRVTRWGLINLAEEDPFAFVAGFMNMNQQPFLYENSSLIKPLKPDEQFIHLLEKRKGEYLDSSEVQDAKRHAYVLKVELCENEKDVWRRIEVPAAIDLSKFHDQVLVPCMGWARGYHGYVFEDPKDGAVIGPYKYDGYIDMMHVSMTYTKIMDDRAFPLSGILQKEGDAVYYTYDLGDQWEHRIELERIILADEGASRDSRVVLIDGAGACPPEDGNGLDGKSNCGYAEFLSSYKKNRKKLKMKEAVREATRTATNYAKPWMGPPVKFRPLEFDIAFHRRMLQSMLAGPSVKKKNSALKDREAFHESTRACNNCGDRIKVLNKCTACRKVSYCSRECQVEDWKEGGHKKECKRNNKRSK
mmetsp:Transcript_6115/g.13337  ORF Transcript_6115/g.13337 Transcript_6115/m.13337 type:complete len:464 (+) Transcript_6115:108-1499(+)